MIVGGWIRAPPWHAAATAITDRNATRTGRRVRPAAGSWGDTMAGNRDLTWVEHALICVVLLVAIAVMAFLGG